MKTRPARFNFAVILAVVLLRLVANASDGVSTNWHKVNFGGFSFDLPAGMTNVPMRGIDSFVGRCVSSNLLLTFDSYGWENAKQIDTNAVKHYDHFNLVQTVIDGRVAEIVSWQASESVGEGRTNVMCVNFPNVGTNRDGFWITIYCLKPEDCETARGIARSIRFGRKD